MRPVSWSLSVGRPSVLRKLFATTLGLMLGSGYKPKEKNFAVCGVMRLAGTLFSGNGVADTNPPLELTARESGSVTTAVLPEKSPAMNAAEGRVAVCESA